MKELPSTSSSRDSSGGEDNTEDTTEDITEDTTEDTEHHGRGYRLENQFMERWMIVGMKLGGLLIGFVFYD